MANPTSDVARAYYARRLKASEVSATLVGWKDEQAQSKRFEQLLKVIDVDEGRFSLNDLGCGVGDFSEFLSRKGFTDFAYFGYDVFDFMIERATRLYGTDRKRTFARIGDANEMAVADYSIASGLMNLKFDAPDAEWLEYVLSHIAVLNRKSRKGFAFNALTKYSDPEFMKPELYYADPCFLFDYCKRHIARDVALLHDYQEYDFTIIVRKAEGRASRPR